MFPVKQFLMFFVLLSMVIPVRVLASTWPSSTTGTDIGTKLLAADPLFEPSGIVYHPLRGTLIAVSDEGQVAEIKTDGTLVNEWKLGSTYDLEDVTLVDEASSIVYLGDENTSKAFAFDLSTGALTGDAWNFSSKITEVLNLGMEALTWVPDGSHPYGTTTSGGVFYAGWQYDGNVYVFEPDLSVSGYQTYLGKITSAKGYTNTSGLTYGQWTDTIYLLYGASILEELDSASTLSSFFTAPGSDQEGIAVVESCSTKSATMVLAEDSTKRIMSYSGFPIACPDKDGDGVDVSSDCNDEDATVSSMITYYVDADRDGYGSSVSAEYCLSSAPAGYADNADDLYDNARIEIYGDGKDNDGDPSIDEANTLAENGRHPIYSAYDVNTSGYITSVSITSTGAVRITYLDGAMYDYTIFTLATSGYKLTAVSGTSYYKATRGGQTAVLNGLTGEVKVTGKYMTTAPKWKFSKIVKP